MNELNPIQLYIDNFFAIFFPVNQPVVVSIGVAFLLETQTTE